MYRRLLGSIKGLKFQQSLPDRKAVCWLFSFLVTPSYGHTRNQLMKYLRTKGIDSRPFFYPLNVFPMYKSKEKFPVSTQLSLQGINIPSFPDLKMKEINYIVQVIKEYAQT